jgi:hypothetical protein
MPQMFLELEDGGWGIAPLEAATYVAGPNGLHPPQAGDDRQSPCGCGALLARLGDPRDAAWLLLASPDCAVRVNGEPVTLGARLLRHQDEMVLRRGPAGATWRGYFSAERSARVQPFPGDEPAVCPRCKHPILPGKPAVKCPYCGVFHHNEPEGQRNCWTYSAHCATGCGQTTELDGQLHWTPEEL